MKATTKSGITLEINTGIDDLQMREYDQFLLANPKSMVYGTRKYIRFLRDVTGGTPLFIFAREGERLIGTLPALIFSSITGTCMNALPWYGSNPGITTAAADVDDAEIRTTLLKAFCRLAESQDMISATAISNPTEPQEPYESVFGPCPWGKRVGMISTLTPGGTIEHILKAVHQKTRNQINKALSGPLRVRSGERYMADILDLHHRNMKAIGAAPKTAHAFKMIAEHFNYGPDYTASVAINTTGAVTAGLVTLYANQTAEYFIPGLDPDYRDFCPMHLLITQAMLEAMIRGMNYWNWGGTVETTQGGVYHFKERWNPEKMPYGYYAKVTNLKAYGAVKNMKPETVKDEFNGFFVAPFSR